MKLRRLLTGMAILVITLTAGPPRVSASGAWRWPADPHPVIRGYEAPPTAYGAGHRGIDLAVHPGQRVQAPAGGVVSFAGVVVDRPLVSVQLQDGVLVTLEPVLPVVHAGEAVEAGDALGVAGSGGHCGQACLHLGARVHGAYVSPLLFLGGIPRAVLLPMDGTVPAGAQARGWAVR